MKVLTLHIYNEKLHTKKGQSVDLYLKVNEKQNFLTVLESIMKNLASLRRLNEPLDFTFLPYFLKSLRSL